jgi:DNA invertase Pin-like site-specific DNA recombinase
MPAVFCYIRVSSKKQSQADHVSLDLQEKACLEYFNQNFNKSEYSSCTVISEVGSARFFSEQEKLNQLINHDLNANDVILVYNVSRLTRDSSAGINMLYHFAGSKINVISVTEKISLCGSRLMFRQKLVEANEESDVISERVQAANNFIKSRGGHLGPAPYGYMIERKAIPSAEPHSGKVCTIRTLVLNPDEVKIISRIRAMVHNEAIQKRAEGENIGVCNIVAEILNDFGVSRRGKPWTTHGVLTLYREYLNKTDIIPETGNVYASQDDQMEVEMEEDEEIYCAKCNGYTSEKPNEIILCDGLECKMAFHQKCINLRRIPEGPFFCSVMCKFSVCCEM